MYQLSSALKYSFFDINEKESPPVQNHCNHDNSTYIKAELESIESQQQQLDEEYALCMNHYGAPYNNYYLNTENQTSMLDKITFISNQKRDLEVKKKILLERLKVEGQNSSFSPRSFKYRSNVWKGDFLTLSQGSYYSSNKNQVDLWSPDIYNHTCARILDRQKFMSPTTLLGECSSSFGFYNYTYFVNQIPDEVEVFDYSNIEPVENKYLLPKQVQTQPPPLYDNSSSEGRSIHINDILKRSTGTKHVIILRGLPGSGKTSFCQAFKETEIANGQTAPRILSLDQFFVEDSGNFKYDETMEPLYREELFKLFKRQIDEGFFSMIILDCVNQKIEQFNQFYDYAEINLFGVCILELKVSPTICAKRAEKKYDSKQIYKMASEWQETPAYYDKLDATSFIQDSFIQDVEMEDVENDEDDDDIEIDDEDESEDESEITPSGFFKSKWDEDFEDTKERLDGVKHVSHDQHTLNIRDYLRKEMESLTRNTLDEKDKGKHVKWADFEELKKQKKRKELGFVAGYTDWNKLMASDLDVAEAALVQVRYY